ncbi:MAG: hypothetical protein P4M13_05085 [Alphaproteobacteria bacterium]|nr:hypothetical protein [Alphaproteobacteria bacterium]
MHKIYMTGAKEGIPAMQDVGASVEDNVIMPRRWMKGQAAMRQTQQAVNANQLTSISAMIAYISYHSGQSEFKIERGLSDRFNVPNAKCLAADDFDAAIRYLADIIP